MNKDITERIMQIGKGNPGALTICMKLIQTFGIDALELLEKSGMVGCDVWDFYKRDCGENIFMMYATLIIRDEHRN